MTAITRHISYIIIAALMACGVWACSDDRRFDPDRTDGDGEEKYMLLLRISPIDAGETADTEVTERIKSLRIIVLTVPESEGGADGGAAGGADGANGGTAAAPEIEYNRLITPEEFGTTTAAGFQYEVMLLTTRGKKDIYLIANEESVGSIAYQPTDDSTLDTKKLPATFPKFLERYEKNSENPVPDAAEFREAVEAIYFQPDYTPVAKERYLPYMSHYRVEAVKGEETKRTMYLVPVATKFTFKFVNKRDGAVTVSKISVESTDTDNFLLARVGGDDYEKSFDGTTMYWVDWLAKVSEESHKYPGYSENMAFNERYGWISDYEIPEKSKLSPTEFIDDGKSVTVPAQTIVEEEDGTKTNVPSVVVLGPYYRPESLRNETDNEKDVVYPHVYRLTLKLKDSDGDGDGPEFDNVAIENMHALFRNTSVYITVTMSSGDVEVYAEIAEWNRYDANGYVNKGEDGTYVNPEQ